MDNTARSGLLVDVTHALNVYPPPPQKNFKFTRKTKRYGAYFPSWASFNARKPKSYASDAAYSTWEFAAPLASLGSRGRQSTDTSCESGGSTPAQEIAIRYRNGQLFMESTASTASRSSSPSQYSGFEPPSWEVEAQQCETPDIECMPVVPGKQLKALYRQSRQDALQVTLQEAMAIAKANGKGPKDKLQCPRPGCHDVVDSVNALSYHLHIHDIHDRLSSNSITCSRCKERYENQNELDVHQCRKSRLYIPASPFKNFRVSFGMPKLTFNF